MIIYILRYIGSNRNIHRIRFNAVSKVTKVIYDQRKEYLDFLKREFGQDRRFHFFFHLAQDWGNIDSEIKKSFCGTDEFYEVIRCAAECGLPLNIHDMFMRPGARICFAAKKNAFLITSDGANRKCSGHLYKPYNYLGNIDNPNKLDE